MCEYNFIQIFLNSAYKSHLCDNTFARPDLARWRLTRWCEVARREIATLQTQTCECCYCVSDARGPYGSTRTSAKYLRLWGTGFPRTRFISHTGYLARRNSKGETRGGHQNNRKSSSTAPLLPPDLLSRCTIAVEHYCVTGNDSF